MKTASYIILIALSLMPDTWCAAQSLQKTWVTEKWQYISFNGNHATLNNSGRMMAYYLCNGHLSLKEEHTFVIDSVSKTYIDSFNYKVLQINADSLVLQAPWYAAPLLFDSHNDTIILLDSAFASDTNVRFQKLFFTATRCYGTCPAFDIEIDSSGTVFFKGTYNTGIYIGTFKGRLNSKKLLELKVLLRHSALNNFPANTGVAIDAPYYYYTFCYNGIKKRCKGYSVPGVARPLWRFLMSCYHSCNLAPYHAKHNWAHAG